MTDTDRADLPGRDREESRETFPRNSKTKLRQPSPARENVLTRTGVDLITFFLVNFYFFSDMTIKLFDTCQDDKGTTTYSQSV